MEERWWTGRESQRLVDTAAWWCAMNETDALARIPEAVAALGISRSKLYLMMATGQLAYTKIGRSRKLPRRELNRLVRENTVARRSAGEDLRGLKDAGRSAPAPAFSASGR